MRGLQFRNYNGEPLTDLHVAEIKGQVAFLLSDASDEIERLRAEVGSLRDQLNAEWYGYQQCYAELLKAEAEVEALRADKSRLDWLENTPLTVDMFADPDNAVVIWFGTDPAARVFGATLREATDRARAKDLAR